MSNLPKYATEKIASHNFDQAFVARASNFGTGAKKVRQFIAYPQGLYENGADAFGERHLTVEEIDVMTGSTVRTWTAIVGNGRCYQF